MGSWVASANRVRVSGGSTHSTAPASSTFVLANTIPYMPVGSHLAVVDPGVGGARRPLALRDKDGTTLVLVTHDPEVARLAQRRIHLRAGRVERIEQGAIESAVPEPGRAPDSMRKGARP